MGSSGCSSSTQEEKPSKSLKEGRTKRNIKDLTILEVYVGVNSLRGGGSIKFGNRILSGCPEVLTGISSNDMYHVALFLVVDNSNKGILLEYGKYYPDNPIEGFEEIYLYYYDQNGLRFGEMELEQFFKYSDSGYVQFLCGKTITIKSLLIGCHLKDDWQAIDYNVKSHNCQTFVYKVCKLLELHRNGKAPLKKKLKKESTPDCLRQMLV